LAYYTKIYLDKIRARSNEINILGRSLPYTIVLDTWAVWESETRTVNCSEQAVVALLVDGSPHSGNIDRHKLLNACLSEAKAAMLKAEGEYAVGVNTANRENGSVDVSGPVWILKGSTVNKGAGIYIVHVFEQLVDICWSEPDIREW
jgi:hypothetical protein